MEQSQELDSKERILKNPYSFIVNWAENRLKHFGKRVFPYLCLQPISLIMPGIPYGGTLTRGNLHTLILSPSGSAKTSCAQIVEKITFEPLQFGRITEARAETELDLHGKTRMSLISWDVERIFKDKEVIKILEGVLGEEKSLMVSTMRQTINEDMNVIFYGAGLPQSITAYSQRGLIQRLIPIVVFHTEEEKMQIATHINNMIGNMNEQQDQTSKIKDYYNLILEIQEGKNEDYSKIDSYIIPDDFKQRVLDEWKLITLSKKFNKDIYTFRELQDAYRYMCASAVLNRFKRSIETIKGKNYIILEKNDLNLAIFLFQKEMNTKLKIVTMDNLMNDAGSRGAMKIYERIQNDSDISFIDKKMAEILIEQKYGNVAEKMKKQ